MLSRSDEGSGSTMLVPRQPSSVPRASIAWSTVTAAAGVAVISAARITGHGSKLTATLSIGLPLLLVCLASLGYALLKRRYLRRVRIIGRCGRGDQGSAVRGAYLLSSW